MRALAFGPEERFARHLGHYVAGWELPDATGLPPGSVGHNTPGRLISMGRDNRGRAGAFALFRSPRLDFDRHDLDRQRELLTEAFAGMGWETPRLLAHLAGATELYFDSISRGDVQPWSRGRVAIPH